MIQQLFSCSSHSPLLLPAASTDSAGFWGSGGRRPTLAPDVAPPPAFTLLLLLGAGVEVEAVTSRKSEDPGLVLTQPGAALAVADRTWMAPVLVGGLEPTESWGSDLTSAAADGGCGGKNDKRGHRKRSVLTASSRTVNLLSITARFN